jgi:hypothetical protein
VTWINWRGGTLKRVSQQRLGSGSWVVIAYVLPPFSDYRSLRGTIIPIFCLSRALIMVEKTSRLPGRRGIPIVALHHHGEPPGVPAWLTRAFFYLRYVLPFPRLHLVVACFCKGASP